MDVAAIRPGMDFEQALDEALNDCDVMLALIGPAWLSNPHSRRRRRLDDPDDYVRLELEAALGRKITVIPVLVQGARMPAHGQLPPSLAAFARRQAFHLSDHRWHPTPSL